MRGRAWSAMGLAALLAFQPACGPGTLSEQDRAAVEEEMDGFVASLFEAMNAGDVDGIAGHYDAGPEFFYVGCTVVTRGFDRVRSLMRMYYGSHPDVRFNPQVQATRVLDRDAAAVTVSATTSADEHLFWTFVVHRTAEGWKIAQEHESWSDCPGRRPHPDLQGEPPTPDESG